MSQTSKSYSLLDIIVGLAPFTFLATIGSVITMTSISCENRKLKERIVTLEQRLYEYEVDDTEIIRGAPGEKVLPD